MIAVIGKILRHFGLWSDTPPLAPVRAHPTSTPGRESASRSTAWTPCPITKTS
jgi:hypothetical protein